MGIVCDLELVLMPVLVLLLGCKVLRSDSLLLGAGALDKLVGSCACGTWCIEVCAVGEFVVKCKVSTFVLFITLFVPLARLDWVSILWVEICFSVVDVADGISADGALVADLVVEGGKAVPVAVNDAVLSDPSNVWLMTWLTDATSGDTLPVLACEFIADVGAVVGRSVEDAVVITYEE